MGDKNDNTEEMATTTHELKLSYDYKTGRLAYTVDASTDAIDPEFRPNDIGSSVANSVASAFSKMKTDFLSEIEDAISKSDHSELYNLLNDSIDTGKLALQTSDELFDLLISVDVRDESEINKQTMFKARLVIAEDTGRYDELVDDCEEFATLLDQEDDSELFWNVKLARANGLASSGKKELARFAYQEILKSEGQVSAGVEAWTHQGLQILSKPGTPEFKEHSKIAADKFLESGDRHNAAKCFAISGKEYTAENPLMAIKYFEKSLGLFPTPSLSNSDKITGIHQALASLFHRLERYSEANEQVAKSIELRRKHIGSEPELRASLELRKAICRDIGDDAEVEKITTKIEQLDSVAPNAEAQILDQISRLQELDECKREDLAKEIMNSGSEHQILAYHSMCALSFDLYSRDVRVSHLDSAIGIMEKQHYPDREHLSLLYYLYGDELMEIEDFGGAISYFKKAVQTDRLNQPAAQKLAAMLWKQKSWDELIAFCDEHISVHGKQPTVLFTKGRALYELGRADEAVPILNEAKNLDAEDNPMFEEWLMKALNDAQNPDFHGIRSAREEFDIPIGLDEINEIVGEFAHHISSKHRMSFWRMEKGDRKWTNSPEKLAGQLFETFLSARLGNRLELFDEIKLGAGYADFYIKLSGGISLIVELKMCGKPYSLSYAKGGLKQLSHYLEMKKTSIGYLIIFDSRKRDFGKGIRNPETHGKNTFPVEFIDVRPEPPSK